MSPMQTATFITGHYYLSKRRAGFHNLADAACALGYRVNFVTVGYSLFSFLRGDYRTRIPGISKNYNTLVKIRDNFYSYVYFTIWHPMTLLLPCLNRLSMRWMDSYGRGDLKALLPIIRETDVFIFESGPGLFLFDRFKHENPQARMVYRVSDDIRFLGSTHPRLLEVEQRVARQFNCISVPSYTMTDKFPGTPTRLDRHGLNTQVFDACDQSPYAEGSTNAIFVGAGHMDYAFLHAAAHGNPECDFTVIGPFTDTLHLPNVHFLGELAFKDSIAYIKFADVGLVNRPYHKGYATTLTDSLKVIQYRYCGLPIVSPDFIDLRREGVFYYTPGDVDSCVSALRGALRNGRRGDYAREVHTWLEVAATLLTPEPSGRDTRRNTPFPAAGMPAA